MDLLQKQIELEKQMTELSVNNYRKELEKVTQSNQFGCSTVAVNIISKILNNYVEAIAAYLDDYSKGKAVRSTLAADVINRLNDVDAVAFIAAKVIFNSIWMKVPTTAMYKAIGQGIEDEFKMREFKKENSYYYESIQKDLNSRGAKANRKKNITTGVFNHRLDFHLDRWTITEKFQTGLVLTRLFVESTGLVEFQTTWKKGKSYKCVIPTQQLVNYIENLNGKLELLQPFFLPMIYPPKDWTSVLDGGYISPHIKRNKLVKNNDKEYLRKLETAKMPIVYEAVNHLQATAWQINKDVLTVVEDLWREGRAIAELPDREDEPLIPYPYPDKTKDDACSEEEKEVIKKWKRDTYEIHKRNVQKRSIRILVSQILSIARQFKDYGKIYFPHQMDFRGRLYPIPVLLQPQGTDLAKSLLRFTEGKDIKDEKSKRWFYIHGANVYGYDKACYNDRVGWVIQHMAEIKSYAQNPIQNRGWAEADKPFQFLAWCMEFNSYCNSPDTFTSHIPIQLDGTCNGLQHYSALLRDEVGGRAVNLLDSDKPSDIYAKVAEKLEEKLLKIRQEDAGEDSQKASQWLDLGINRKLTKRPVMVLPYGGTLLSCREYIGEYLTDNYSSNYIWKHFGIGQTPAECVFKSSTWLSKLLWQAIQETLNSAIVGMDYLRKLARAVSKANGNKGLEWLTPAGLLIKQAYKQRKKKMIRTELYGNIIKCTVNIDQQEVDTQRQLNGICPNFIHSLDASCLMFYLIKCKKAGINGFMTVHDCYGTWAKDTETSARLLREAFVELYQQSILENFTEDLVQDLELSVPELPARGALDIQEVLRSEYFFN